VDPVTEAYLTCLQTLSKIKKDTMYLDYYIDPANNDLSMNHIHRIKGWLESLESMSKFDEVLRDGEMIEVLKDEG